MIVVVANRWDTSARAFASRWPDHEIRVLTSEDLSTRGWRQALGREGAVPEPSVAVIEGALVTHDRITGVLTRLAAVGEDELFEIALEDRPYVAAEMNSFLWFWLSSLDCPVINRPSTVGLCGPFWRRERWIQAAVEVGCPALPVYRRAALASSPTVEIHASAVTITVVGDRSLGNGDRILHHRARHLAEIAEVGLLAVEFTGPDAHASFVRADVFPALGDDTVADALLEHFKRLSERNMCATRP